MQGSQVLVTMEAQSGPAELDPRADEDHARVQVRHASTKSNWLRGPSKQRKDGGREFAFHGKFEV